MKAETIVSHVRFPERCHVHLGTSLGMVGAVGCEIMGSGRRTLGKGGAGGRINEGGAFTIPILSMWKNRGGGGRRINEGGSL